MSRLRLACAFAALVLMADTAAAQFPAGRGVIRGGVPRSPVAPPPPGAVGLFAIDPVEPGRPVLNLPYTAEAVTEMDQLLPDGTRTKRRTSAAVARDSRGRVRREHTSVMLGPFVAERSEPLVTVSDPGAGTQLLIDPERQVATFARVGPGAGRASSPDGDPRGRIRALGEPAATTSPLGFRSIEGVMAEGSRTTMTIAGRRAGGSPGAVISERWYSHELQVVVMTKRSDPRFGETTYRLTNIILAEPSMELFEVPSGFTVVDRPVGPPGMRGPVR